jgi:hypothetical protein
MVDAVLSLHYQFLRGVIPFPQKPFCVAKTETIHGILKRLDDFAESIAAAYDNKDTTRLIRSMYFDGQNVSMKAGLLGEGMIASHRRSTGMFEPEHTVAFDACLEHCPILKRIFMIHEIAVHVGQFRSRAIDIRNSLGQVQLVMVDTPHYRHFTEMTAACIDKLLIDAIPRRFIDAEINTVADENTRSFLHSILQHWRDHTVKDFMRLEHRKGFPDGQLSEREIGLFEARPEVAFFMNDTYPKSVCHHAHPEM